MRDEAVGLLDAIDAYNLAHEGDSDDAEIDAAFAMENAALCLLRRVAAADPDVAKRLADFEAALGSGRAETDTGSRTDNTQG
jgi:hypothetical protein